MIKKITLSSAILAALLVVPYAAATPITIFEDNFDRDGSHVADSVGNNWETVREDSASYVRVKNSELRLRGMNYPEVYRKISTTGYNNISIEFEWRQANGENKDALNLFWASNVTTPIGGSPWTTTGATPVWTIKLSTYQLTQGTVSVAINNGGGLADAAFGFNVDVTEDNEQAFITGVRVTGDAVAVADTGSTAFLLGAGMLGLAAFRRRMGRN
jgi:hypothetical protein